MALPDNPHRSARLLYRAVESPEDDALFLALQQDPVSHRQSTPSLAKPQAKRDAMSHQKYFMEEALIGVVICLPPPDPQTQPVPVGIIHLEPLVSMAQHRFTNLGVNILEQYQSQGFGSEAIRWVLEWAFETAGLHRVGVKAFEYNNGARKLYQKLGFEHEGTAREMFFHKGRFWDDYMYGMLEDDWRALRAGGKL